MLVLTINVEPDVYQALRAEAIRQECSMAKLTRIALRRSLFGVSSTDKDGGDTGTDKA